MPQQVNVYKKLVMKPGAIVEGSWNGSFDAGGTTYYVNNITGSDTADGLSWNSAVKQVVQAIVLSEASRKIHPGTTTNDYIRNRIIVQGTGTAYTKLVALPLYCDIIGLGADPRGTGDGVARIGSDTAAESGVVSTSTVRGLNVYNIQFQAGKSCYPFSSTTMFRSRFENCTFMTNGAATGQPAAAFYATTNSGSLVFDHCLIGGTSCSLGTEPAIGMQIAGASWTNSLVEYCFIAGNQGITVANTVTSSWGSMFKNNFIGKSSAVMSLGVNDDIPSGREGIAYIGNYFHAVAPFDIDYDVNRAVGNYWKGALITGANA